MGVMESSTWYLSDETLKYRNYPEVATVKSDVESILDYAMRVNNAILDYTNGVFDKVDVDSHELLNKINLCRSVAETLGNASNVCYDLLLEIRTVQNVLQTVLYIKNRYGSQYVGTPTNT